MGYKLLKYKNCPISTDKEIWLIWYLTNILWHDTATTQISLKMNPRKVNCLKQLYAVCVVQLLSCVWYFATSWTIVWQPPPPILHCLWACPNSCSLHWWEHLTISFSAVPLFLLLLIFPNISIFSNKSFALGGQRIYAIVHCISWMNFPTSLEIFLLSLFD